MANFSFPDGSYFSVIGNIRIGAGGQTRMALLRHRLMLSQAGLDVPLVTFNPVPSYDPIRASLLEEKLLLPDSRLLNMHESLRILDFGSDPEREAAPPIDTAAVGEVVDGYRWRLGPADTDRDNAFHDYLRADGSRYAHTPATSMIGTTTIFDHEERIVVSFDGLGELWRWWLQQILPATDPVFLVSDSRFIASELGLLDDPRIHLLHQMHNPHLTGQRHWNSPESASYVDSMRHLERFDALATLTQRQREDIRRRHGATDNLVVMPNPTEPLPAPEPLPERQPDRIVMVARLDSQKRLDLALTAFARVAAANQAAHLDIYGEGPERDALEQQMSTLGLNDRVTLHGHQPHAAEQFWTADLAWLTSAFEGFSLAILEARVRACPSVSFDVPYGPSEQIDDGVDGILVPAGDTDTLADRTLDLLGDRDLLESMRAPARAGALSHGHESFLHEWAAACRDAALRKPFRTTIEQVNSTVSTFRWSRRGLKLQAELAVHGHGDLDTAVVHWQAYLPDSPEPLDLPVDATRDGHVLTVSGSHPASVLPFDPQAAKVTVRLVLVWNNSSHHLDLTPRRTHPSRSRRAIRRLRRRFS